MQQRRLQRLRPSSPSSLSRPRSPSRTHAQFLPLACKGGVYLGIHGGWQFASHPNGLLFSASFAVPHFDQLQSLYCGPGNRVRACKSVKGRLDSRSSYLIRTGPKVCMRPRRIDEPPLISRAPVAYVPCLSVGTEWLFVRWPVGRQTGGAQHHPSMDQAGTWIRACGHADRDASPDPTPLSISHAGTRAGCDLCGWLPTRPESSIICLGERTCPSTRALACER